MLSQATKAGYTSPTVLTVYMQYCVLQVIQEGIAKRSQQVGLPGFSGHNEVAMVCWKHARISVSLPTLGDLSL